MAATSSFSSQYSGQQLKNNVQSRLDYLSEIFLSLSERVAKYDAENQALKELIAILLHFKYMLQFLRSNLVRDEDLFRRLGPDAAILFKADMKQCLAKFNAALASNACLDFAAEKTSYYRASGGAAYCSYSEEDILAPVMPPTTVKRGRFGGGGGEVHSGGYSRSSANHSNASSSNLANANESFSSDREMASNASDSEHLEIKLEPQEIVERANAELSDDSSRTGGEGHRSANANSMLTAMLDKPILNASTSAGHHHHHRLVSRDRNNDLKLTLRKVVKRSMPQGSSYLEEDGQQTSSPNSSVTPLTNDKQSTSSSNHSNHINSSNSSKADNTQQLLYQRKHPRAAKANAPANYAVFERDRKEAAEPRDAADNYDFDYEREDYEFEQEDAYQESAAATAIASYNAAGQLRCPQSGCGLCFDAEDDLNEHLRLAHFANMDFNTFSCLVDGCNEKFPNLARATVHMKNVHPEEYITCDHCLKQVKAHYMRKHVYMRHRFGAYRCSQDNCDYVAEYYHELEKHRYMVHNSRGAYNAWGDYLAGAGGGGGSASNHSAQLVNSPSSSSSNVFFPSNPIAAAIVASHNNNSSSGSINGSHSFSNHNISEDQPSSANQQRQPPTTTRKYVCKFPDSNCSYWHESRNRVLQHIRTQHLNSNGGASSVTSSGRPTSSSSTSSSNKNGGSAGSLVLEDRASEYLEVYDVPEGSSFYD